MAGKNHRQDYKAEAEARRGLSLIGQSRQRASDAQAMRGLVMEKKASLESNTGTVRARLTEFKDLLRARASEFSARSGERRRAAISSLPVHERKSSPAAPQLRSLSRLLFRKPVKGE